MNVGMLLVRLVLGSLFVGHGTQKLFGWWHGAGVRGTGDTFQRGGFRPGRWFAVLAGLAESVGGLIVALGLLTPLGSAAVIGVMTTAIGAVHLRNGLWNTNGGIEFPLLAAVVAAAIAFVGPGHFSLDHVLGWHLDGSSWGVGAIVLGLVSGIAMLGWRRIQLRRSTPQAPHDSPRHWSEAA